MRTSSESSRSIPVTIAVDKETRLSKHRFLIIGGASKAGTTSVFTYLSEHPQICASATKETRFFLDPDYPLRSEMRCQRDGPDAYLSFFDVQAAGSEKTWKLEATPDYLYSPRTPDLIKQTLPNACFIFILREPSRRLLSFYQFGRQLNEISRAMTFDDYVELQKNNPLSGRAQQKYRHPVFDALEHGRYSHYLGRFLELFGRPAVYIGFYEELQRDPHSFMIPICQWADIDETFYQDYSFQIKNAGFTARSSRLHRVYFETRARARRLVRQRPRLRSALRQMGHKVNSVYQRLNSTKREQVLMSHSTKDFIAAYYQDEPARLKELLGIDVPWLQTVPR